jgi:hypothetical protein
MVNCKEKSYIKKMHKSVVFRGVYLEKYYFIRLLHTLTQILCRFVLELYCPNPCSSHDIPHYFLDYYTISAGFTKFVLGAMNKKNRNIVQALRKSPNSIKNFSHLFTSQKHLSPSFNISIKNIAIC